MKRFFLTYWLLFIAASSVWGQDRAPLESVLPVLENYIEKAIEAEGIPGAMVVIVKDGKVAYMKGFGVQIWGQADPIDAHTPFALASVTKNMTNTLVARLVDQGKLDWKDKVTKYLPEFQLSDPNITQEMTIEDLLSHRSGLPGFAGDSLIELCWHASEIISALKLIPIVGEFRKTYDYQNALVGLMGNIIEKVTGKPLQQVYQEELFTPIGLTETRIGERTTPTMWEKLVGIFGKKYPQPALHDRYLGKTRYLSNGNPALYTFPSSSGIITTGQDMAKWLLFQLNMARVNGTELVSEKNLNEMRSPHVEVEIHGGRQFPKNRIPNVQYGMGWFIHDYMGVGTLSHMGGMAGTRAFLLIVPKDNLGIAIMTNFGGMRVTLFPEAVRNKFLDLYLNVKDEIDWAKKLRDDIQKYYERRDEQRRTQMLRMLAPAHDLKDYVGLYENKLYGRIEFQTDGKDLFLIYRDRPKMMVKHWNGNSFDFLGSNLAPGFSGVDQGEITFSDERPKSSRMMIDLLHEGVDSMFHRVE